MSDIVAAPWAARDGWHALVREGRFGRAGGTGVVLGVLSHRDMATIIARPGEEAALSTLMRALFALDLPLAGRASFGETCDLVWSAPGQWLAVAKAAGVLDGLAGRLAGAAAVTAQGDARALVALSGSDMLATLSKGVSIDLHPSVFTTGSAAGTGVAHVSVQIWRVDDTPTIIMAVPRSFAGAVWSWLTASASEYGYAVRRAVA